MAYFNGQKLGMFSVIARGYKGDYKSTVDYKSGDVVRYSGNVYLCKTSTSAGDLPTSNNWTRLNVPQGTVLSGDWTIEQDKLDNAMTGVSEQLMDFLFGSDSPTAGFTSYTGIKFRTTRDDTGVYNVYILQFRDSSGNYVDVYSKQEGESGEWVNGFWKGDFRFETPQIVSESFFVWFNSFATQTSEVPDGYIKPEGTLSITENGTHDVTNYASAEVNVPTGITPSGTLTITENGTHDVTSYASANVNVPTSGGAYKGEWDSSTTYSTGDIVTQNGNVYRSIVDNHTNASPADTVGMVWEQLNTSGGTYQGEWDTNITYSAGDIVVQNGNIYRCLSSNTGCNPPDYIGMVWELLYTASGGSGSSGASKVTLSARTYTINNYYPDFCESLPDNYSVSASVSGTYEDSSSVTFDYIKIDGNNGSNDAPYVYINFYSGGSSGTNVGSFHMYSSGGYPSSITISSDTQVSSYFYDIFMSLV